MNYLDQDLYKLKMAGAYSLRHSGVQGEFELTVRTQGIDLTPIAGVLRERFADLKGLTPTQEEKEWCTTNGLVATPALPEIHLEVTKSDSGIRVFSAGLIKNSSLSEIFTMSIISEQYFRNLYGSDFQKVEDALFDTICGRVAELKELMEKDPSVIFKFCEFGSRRRYSASLQKRVVMMLLEELPDSIIGTSNMHLARTLGIKPIGTVAHEWFMLYQALTHPALSQSQALIDWVAEYPEAEGILTDTLGAAKWSRDFTKELALRIKGLRHDSADPYIWGEQRLLDYQAYGIDPQTKGITFSDSLTLASAFALAKTFNHRIPTRAGIGTELSNPTAKILNYNHKAVSQVMKLVAANGLPVAKISDDAAKAQCPRSAAHLSYIKYLVQGGY